MVLPPVNAKVVPTACDYCVVGCAYKAYIWPVGTEGGPSASENALRTDFPVGALTGKWISPNMQNIVTIRGEPHHVLVIPDGDATVVNVGGDHSVRGGTLAQKLYSPNTPNRDRLQHPRLRISDSMIDIPWDDALNLAADISRYVLDNYGEMAWAQKMFSYHYYENTYALTKVTLDAVNTPFWGPHDKPADGADIPGLSDAGINAFSAAYQDWKDAEVIYVSGVTLYETKTILFQEWVQPGGAKLVVVNPRKDFTAAYAEANGGIHLQLIPGTDTPLNNAIARVIIENGWQDSEFIDQSTVSDTELAQETSWRRRMFGKTYQQYRDFILSDDSHIPENAAPITGVPADQIRAAADMLARPKPDGSRPATSMMPEKGNYWAHNYENTASFSGLGLLVGAGGRPGKVMARAGGHQRGMIKGGSYPKDKSPDTYKGNKIELNLDRWVTEGIVRFIWVIGTTWLAAMGASQHLADQVRRLTRGTGPELTMTDAFPSGDSSLNLQYDAILDILKARVGAGGMVLVQQEVYENALTEFEGRHNIRPMDTIDQMGEAVREVEGWRLTYQRLIS